MEMKLQTVIELLNLIEHCTEEIKPNTAGILAIAEVCINELKKLQQQEQE